MRPWRLTKSRRAGHAMMKTVLRKYPTALSKATRARHTRQVERLRDVVAALVVRGLKTQLRKVGH